MLRKVNVYDWKCDKKIEVAEFHGWGFEGKSEAGSEFLQVSIAIVELKSGKVITTHPSNITFIKTKEEKQEVSF